jgi:hypothetical protein
VLYRVCAKKEKETVHLPVVRVGVRVLFTTVGARHCEARADCKIQNKTKERKSFYFKSHCFFFILKND